MSKQQTIKIVCEPTSVVGTLSVFNCHPTIDGRFTPLMQILLPQPIKIEPTGSFLLVGTVVRGLLSPHNCHQQLYMNCIRLDFGVQALRQTKYIRHRSYRQILPQPSENQLNPKIQVFLLVLFYLFIYEIVGFLFDISKGIHLMQGISIYGIR